MLEGVSQVNPNSVRFWTEHVKVPSGVYRTKAWQTQTVSLRYGIYMMRNARSANTSVVVKKKESRTGGDMREKLTQPTARSRRQCWYKSLLDYEVIVRVRCYWLADRMCSVIALPDPSVKPGQGTLCVEEHCTRRQASCNSPWMLQASSQFSAWAQQKQSGARSMRRHVTRWRISILRNGIDARLHTDQVATR